MQQINYCITVLIDDDSLSQKELNEIDRIVEERLDLACAKIETTIKETPLRNFQVIKEKI